MYGVFCRNAASFNKALNQIRAINAAPGFGC